MIDIRKSFPGIKAFNGVTLRAFRGEVMGLLGENGAGKSTLIKILSGVYRKDGGKILIRVDRSDIETFHVCFHYQKSLLKKWASNSPEFLKTSGKKFLFGL